MSVKNRLRFSIIALVVIVVVGLSALHVRSVVEARFEDTFKLASIGAMQVESFILQIVDEQTARRDPPPTTLDEVKRVWIEIVEQDDGLAVLLQKLTGNSPAMVEVLVSGAGDRVLAASIPSRKGQKVRSRPSLEDFNRQPWWSKVEDVLTASRDYEVTKPLGIPGEEEPIFAVRVVLSSVLMRAEILPSLQTLAFASGVSLVLSVLLAILAAKIAFRPLARIGDAIDRISRGELDVQKQGKSGESSEESAVESKLSVLGEQFRGARADREQRQYDAEHVRNRRDERHRAEYDPPVERDRSPAAQVAHLEQFLDLLPGQGTAPGGVGVGRGGALCHVAPPAIRRVSSGARRCGTEKRARKPAQARRPSRS